MVTKSELLEFMEKIAPRELAEEYDNVGLLVDGGPEDLEKIMVSLDTDTAVVEEAAAAGVQLLLSHHPLLFHPAKRIVKTEETGRAIIGLLQNKISLLAAHTNFDSAQLCQNFLLRLCRPYQLKEYGPTDDGFHIARLAEPVSLSAILEHIKNEFSLETVRYVGDKAREISVIAACNGGGADFIYSAKELGADLYVSGDLKYHHARFAYEEGLSLVEIGHYEAEISFCRVIKKLLNEKFGDKLIIAEAQTNRNPWQNYMGKI